MAIKEPLHGDNLSQLLQLTSREVGLDLRCCGTGRLDLRALIVRCYNAELRTDVFAEALNEVLRECRKGTLPEAVTAVAASYVLAANAAYDEQKKA